MLKFRDYSLYFTWLLALVATLMSLYLSEIRLLPVCHLCWYQRICLYPIVIILGIATYRNFRGIVVYVLPFTVIGFFLAGYQYLEQMIPGFSPIKFCGMGPACSEIHVKLFGFITLPLMGAGLFVVMALLLLLAKQKNDE
jgi:disulfide bond formation protein DsbB